MIVVPSFCCFCFTSIFLARFHISFSYFLQLIPLFFSNYIRHLFSIMVTHISSLTLFTCTSLFYLLPPLCCIFHPFLHIINIISSSERPRVSFSIPSILLSLLTTLCLISLLTTPAASHFPFLPSFLYFSLYFSSAVLSRLSFLLCFPFYSVPLLCPRLHLSFPSFSPLPSEFLFFSFLALFFCFFVSWFLPIIFLVFFFSIHSFLYPWFSFYFFPEAFFITFF